MKKTIQCCDICGKDMNRLKMTDFLLLPSPLTKYKVIIKEGNKKMDICEDCMKKFKLWVEIQLHMKEEAPKVEEWREKHAKARDTV